MTYFGAVAHLGERFHGMEEVASSILVSSTILKDNMCCICTCFFLHNFAKKDADSAVKGAAIGAITESIKTSSSEELESYL